jgi:hypothetical protein
VATPKRVSHHGDARTRTSPRAGLCRVRTTVRRGIVAPADRSSLQLAASSVHRWGPDAGRTPCETGLGASHDRLRCKQRRRSRQCQARRRIAPVGPKQPPCRHPRCRRSLLLSDKGSRASAGAHAHRAGSPDRAPRRRLGSTGSALRRRCDRAPSATDRRKRSPVQAHDSEVGPRSSRGADLHGSCRANQRRLGFPPRNASRFAGKVGLARLSSVALGASGYALRSHIEDWSL